MLGRRVSIAFVVTVLLYGVLAVVAGTAIGLIHFRDSGYPDSATLLRVGEMVTSGTLYPPIDQPPYLVTVYGPLMYVILGVPYALGSAIGVHPQIPMRLVVIAAYALCLLLVFLMSRRVNQSSAVAWLSVLFATAVTAFADWTTQIRGDFLGAGFSLASMYLILRGRGSLVLTGSAMFAAAGMLTKQTFIAAPIAAICWLILQRRYLQAAYFGSAFALAVAGVYSIAAWREPLLLQHLSAISAPVLEMHGLAAGVRTALSQPVTLFALGGFLVPWVPPWTHTRMILIYWTLAWAVAVLSIPQVGGNINYFFEPLLVSAVLAGRGFRELERSMWRTAPVQSVLLPALLVIAFGPALLYSASHLKQSYSMAIDYRTHKAEWESFLAVVSGRRLLSTYSDVAVHASVPEMPDPYLMSVLELRETWTSKPIISQVDAGTYELIVTSAGDTGSTVGFRGIRVWSDDLWSAVKRRYRPACVIADMEVWLPMERPEQLFSQLAAIGCRSERPLA